MIATSFIASGVLLILTGMLFRAGVLSATTLTAGWVAVFFFASTAASSAHLTVSEIFPMEIRAMAISLFYAVGTGGGGIIGPVLFGWAIEIGTVAAVVGGYYVGAVLMIAAGLAPPLSAYE